MKRTVMLPPGFLEGMPDKLRQQLEAYAGTFKSTKLMSKNDRQAMYNMYGGPSHYNMPIGSISNRELMGRGAESSTVVVGHYTGVMFTTDQDDADLKRLMELELKVAELDNLKSSLATLKSTIGDLK